MITYNRKKRTYPEAHYGFVFFFSISVILILSSFKFSLVAKTKICFIQITDTHISENPGTHQILQQVVEDIKQLPGKPAFVINTGDITEFGSEIEFKHYKNIIDNSGLIFYNAPGNHDVRWSNIGKKRFIKWLGPLYQSFDFNGIHFIVLDTGLLLEQYGHVSQQQLSWLKRDLEAVEAEKPIIIAAHHPIFLEKKYVDNEFELLELLEGYNVILFLCGHGHRNQHWQVNGIHFLMTQATKSDEPGYRLFETDGDSICVFNRNLNNKKTRFDFTYALIHPENMPEFAVNEPKATAAYKSNLPVVISSNDVSKIDVSLDGKGWTTLKHENGKFSQNLAIEHLSEGNYNLIIKLVSKEGKLWLDRMNIRINRGLVKLVSKFTTKDAVLASPAISNNTLFIGSLDGYLYALNADNMNLRWSFKTEGPIVTSPAFHQDTIFVTSGDGCCYAINKERGTQIWKTRAAESIFSSPTYSYGVLFFGSSDSSLHALTSSDGKSVWGFKTNGYIKARPALSNDKVFFGSWDKFFYCLLKKDGQLIWKQKISNNRYFPAATSNPFIYDHKVIVTSHDHAVHAFQTIDGNLNWKHATTAWSKPGYSSPIISEKMVYLGSLTGHLVTLNAQSGEGIWNAALPDSIKPDPIFDSSPVIAGTQVIVGSVGGVLYGVNKDSGKLEWSFKLSDGYIFSSPIVWKNYVFVGSCDGAIYKVKLPE